MARIIIGAGAGYFLGLFFTAIAASGVSFGRSHLTYAVKLQNFDPLMLACVAVGAVMGWAWHSIAIDAGSKDD
jgi:hypothetical protein